MKKTVSKTHLKSTTKEQLIPLILTLVIAGAFIFLLFLFISLLNIFTKTDISKTVALGDVLVGLTIYLKTSIDFAIFMGNLMGKYQGMKNRIAIEIGTAAGNAMGTLIILGIWDFFKDIKILLALMIVVAALVLLKLAEESLEHVKEEKGNLASKLSPVANALETILSPINKFFNYFLRYIIPNLSMKPKGGLGFWGLFSLSLTIPFILGLDDFAGYVPVFNIVNVYGFSIGVILGHMILNIFLFLSPATTIKAVKNPLISLLGSVAFAGLALYGIFEAYKVLFIH